MMHGRGKSDAAIVAEKPTNKAERSAAEPVEPRAVAKGNANQQSTQPGAAPGKRVTGAGAHTIRRESGAPVGPEVGAVCGKAARTDLCGGRGVTRVPTATTLDVACAGSRSRQGASPRLPDVPHRASAATHPVGFLNRPFGLPFGGHLQRRAAQPYAPIRFSPPDAGDASPKEQRRPHGV